MKTRKKESGFFIVEILIVLLIVGILAVALLPNLTTYVQRAKFADVVANATAAKTAVNGCLIQNHGTYASCNTNALAGYPQSLASTNVAAGPLIGGAGPITITGTGVAGVFDADLPAGTKTYILTATYNAADNTVTWTSVNAAAGGTCHAAGLC